MKPYKEKIINKNISERTFSEKNKKDFFWHRDLEDRKIIVIESGKGWFVQLDNCLPQELISGSIITINAYVFHRVIAGSGNLKIKIVKSFKDK